MKSQFPYRVAGDLPRELINFLDDIGRPISAVENVSASPTTEELATALNALLAALRAGKKMAEG